MDKKTKIWLSALVVGTLALITLAYVYRKEISRKLSEFKKNLLNYANFEYSLWNTNGKAKEGDSYTMERLRNYWVNGGGVKGWDDDRMTREFWSAAFISYLMKKGGAGSDFKYSTNHSDYIRDSIKNRLEKNNNPFKGYKPEEKIVEEGDLVCYARQSGVGYETTNSYASHCDLVTNVKKDEGKAVSIGGNVSDSVSKTIVPLDSDGKIDLSRGEKEYFVIIKNLK